MVRSSWILWLTDDQGMTRTWDDMYSTILHFSSHTALIRPHATEEGAEPTTARVVWEFWHKGSGWIAILLAIPTIGLGTTLLTTIEDQETFQYAYGVGAGLILLLATVGMLFDKSRYQSPEDGKGGNDKGEEAALNS